MTTILLIRHAQCEGNVINALTGRTDFDLTSKGKMSANELIEILKEYKIEKIYSSPAIRCIETVRPLAEHLNIDIMVEEDLKEKYFGIYDGKTWDEVKRIDPQFIIRKEKQNEITGIQGQEKTEDVRKRMNDSIYRIAEENEHKTIVICSHGCSIETFLRGIDNVKQTEQREKYAQHNAQVNVLEYKNKGFEIIEINKQRNN